MPYQTQFGDVPTHTLPYFKEMGRTQRYIVRIEEGQSVPRWGSTKHLHEGPMMYLRSDEHVTSFGLPEPGTEHEYIREHAPEFFRDDEHYEAWVEATPVVDLVPNA